MDPEEQQNNTQPDELPNESDLIKAMDILENTARGIDAGESVRQQDLASKMAAGEELSKAEKEELTRLMNGAGDDDILDEIMKSTREVWAEDDTIAEGWNVTPYLDARDTALCKSLDRIDQRIQSSNIENQAVVARLAKGMHAVGMANVALTRRVTQLEDMLKSLTGQSQRQPQQPKGFVGQPNRPTRVGQRYGEDIQKSEEQGGSQPNFPEDRPGQKVFLNNTLTQLIKSTEPGGKNAAEGFGIMRGIDLVSEQAKLENFNEVSPQTMQLIKEHATAA